MGEGVMSAKRTLENLKIFHEGDKTSFKLLKVTGKEVIFRWSGIVAILSYLYCKKMKKIIVVCFLAKAEFKK